LLGVGEGKVFHAKKEGGCGGRDNDGCQMGKEKGRGEGKQLGKEDERERRCECILLKLVENVKTGSA